jgi:hypothetical protein
MNETVIVSAEIVASHDGAAELLVRLRHCNGVESPVILDQETGLKLMRNCNVDRLDDLVGQPWLRIIQADFGE